MVKTLSFLEKKTTPAPIFNARKRPRQAIIADPGNPTSCSGGFPNANSFDLMPIHGFNTNGSNPGKSSFPQRSTSILQTAHGTRPSNPSSSCRNRSSKQFENGNLNNMSYGTVNSFQNPNVQNRPSTANYGNTQYSQRPGPSGPGTHQGTNVLSRQCSGPSGLGSHMISNQRIEPSGIRAYNNKTVQSNPRVGLNGPKAINNTTLQSKRRGMNGPMTYSDISAQFNQNVGPSGPGTYAVKTTKSFQVTGPAGDYGYQKSGPVQELYEKLDYGGAVGKNRGGLASKLSAETGWTNGGSMNKKALQTQTPVQANKVRKEAEVDRSLRIITTNSSGVNRWIKYKEHINLMFEIFGVVSSAVVSDASGTAKEFALRDDAGLMQCIFYEIDRMLPKLLRGHTYRVVGSYDVRNKRMKCLSVRPCTSTELTCARRNIQLQENYLRRLLTQDAREP